MTTPQTGLVPGGVARVYRDGAPGEGVLMCVLGVPQDTYLEVRNLQPGTYSVVDELGNREDFVVDAFAESAWVPVQGAKLAHGGESGGGSGPGQTVIERDEPPLSEKPVEQRVKQPRPRRAKKATGKDLEAKRVPGGPGAAKAEPAKRKAPRKAPAKGKAKG